MAMETIDQHQIIQFADTVHEAAQQVRSRLRNYVETRQMTGDVLAYDGIGTVETRELVGRMNTTTFDDISHTRRKLGRREFVVTLAVDDFDIEGMLSDPKSKYATACVRAMERRFDRVVVDAMFADVQTGRNFENTVTATNDGVLTVNATGGNNLDALMTVKQNFMNNEVGNNGSLQEDYDVVMGISGSEHRTLMQIATLTSRDYSTQMAVEKGVMIMAAGMGLIPFGNLVTNPVLPLTAPGGVRTCFAMAVGGVCVGLSRDWRITVKDRPDLVNVTQVQITGVMGAVRTEGKLIQKYTTTDIP